MFNPKAAALHGSLSGSGNNSVPHQGLSVDIAAGEFIAAYVTWETGDVNTMVFDSAGAVPFTGLTRDYDSGDGKGSQWFYCLSSNAAKNVRFYASFTKSVSFPDITILRFNTTGPVTLLGESSSNSGTGTTTVNLPSLTAGELNLMGIKMFGSATLSQGSARPKPYNVMYGGETSTSHHVLAANYKPTTTISSVTATLSSAQNYITRGVAFSDATTFPATTNVPAWYTAIGPGTVGPIACIDATSSGMRDRDTGGGTWDNANMFAAFSGAAVNKSSFQIGTNTVAGHSLYVHGAGHSGGGSNDSLFMGPFQAEVLSWYRPREITFPLVLSTSFDGSGNPSGCHTYNGPYFDGSSGRNRMLFPGRLFHATDAGSDGNASYYDCAQTTPVSSNPWHALSGTNLGLIWSVLDEANGKIIGAKYPPSLATIQSYDIASDATTVFTGKTVLTAGEYFSALDSKRNIALILWRGAGTASLLDCSNLTANDYTALSAAGTAPSAGSWSAVLYDDVDDRFVVYVGTNTLYYLTNVAGTWTWSSETYPGVTTDAAQTNGTYGRFFPVKQGYVRGYGLVNGIGSQPYLFRPRSAIIPQTVYGTPALPRRVPRNIAETPAGWFGLDVASYTPAGMFDPFTLRSATSGHFASASDSVTFSDSAVAISTLVTVAADTVAFTDSAISATNRISVGTDSVTFSDSAVAGVSQIAVAADTLSFSDSAVAISSLVSAATDTVSFSDSAVTISSLVSAASDTVSFSDSASAQSSLVATGSDTVSFSDSSAAAIQAVAAGADTVIFSDSAIGALTQIAAATDSVTFSDSAVSGVTLPADGTDTISFTDSAIGSIVTGGVIAVAEDSITLTDSAQASLNHAASASDSIAFDDAAAASVSIVAAASDSITLSDSAIAALGNQTFTAVAQDSVAFSDSATCERPGGIATDPKLIARGGGVIKRKLPNVQFRPTKRKKKDEEPATPKAEASPLLLGLLARGLAPPSFTPEPAPLLPDASIAPAAVAETPSAPVEKPEVAPSAIEDLRASMQAQIDQLRDQLAQLQTPPELPALRDPLHDALHAILPAARGPIQIEPDPLDDALRDMLPMDDQIDLDAD